MRRRCKEVLFYFCMGILIILLIILLIRNESINADAYVEEIAEDPISKIQTIEVVEEPQEAVFPRTHEVNCVEFSYQDAQLLLKVGQAEAGNQGSDGIWLVLSCIYNRTISDVFDSTIGGVVYAEGQFSSVSNGSIDRVEISPEAHEALARIERGDIAPSIVAFETTSSNELDKYFTKAFTYRDHTFYTLAK